MKFREVIEVNRSPKIEHIGIYKDNLVLATSDSVYIANMNTNKIEEVEFTKDTK